MTKGLWGAGLAAALWAMLAAPGLARAEGDGPPRVVVVQSAGKGAEHQIQVLTSNSGGWKTVPANGSSPPEAVLGVSASRQPPASGVQTGTTSQSTAPPPASPAPKEPDLVTNGIANVVGSVAGSQMTPEQTTALAVGALATLPPDQLRCVQQALGKATASGLISGESPTFGPTEMVWLARECDLDVSKMMPVLSKAMASVPPAASSRSAAPAVVPPSEERLARMQEWARNGAPPPEPGFEGWQIALLTILGVGGLVGSVHGLMQRSRPRYVVRVTRPERPRLPAPRRERVRPTARSGARAGVRAVPPAGVRARVERPIPTGRAA